MKGTKRDNIAVICIDNFGAEIALNVYKQKSGIKVIALESDYFCLRAFEVEGKKILIGKKLLKGKGSTDINMIRQGIKENKEELIEALNSISNVVVVGSLGDDDTIGVFDYLYDLCKSLNANVYSFLMFPFEFCGPERINIANQVIKKYDDIDITYPDGYIHKNESISDVIKEIENIIIKKINEIIVE